MTLSSKRRGADETPRRLARFAPALTSAVLLAACAGHSAPHKGDAHSGRMRGYVESSRVTDFCPDQNARRPDERCIVTRGYDYSRGDTLVRTYDPAGALLGTEMPDGADLSLTDPEKARVEALVRNDRRTAPVVDRADVMFWTSGFVMRGPGDAYCDRGSRCIRAIAADQGGDHVVLHAVVDLMTDRVVYPFYTPVGSKTAGHLGEK